MKLEDDFMKSSLLEASVDFCDSDYELTADELDAQTDDENLKFYVKWTDKYKQACDYLFGSDNIIQDFDEALKRLTAEAVKGNVLAIYDLVELMQMVLVLKRIPI